jgi:hypothetical protein
LGERLRHRSIEVFDEALRDAVVDGPGGEAELVASLDGLSVGRRVSVIAVLGDAQGFAGPDTLRKVLTTDGASRDMRCAAVLALARRSGADASDVLARALSDRDTVVRRYVRLVAELRDRWDRLSAAEQAWLADLWPQCAPDGPAAGEVAAPQARRLESWVRQPLLGPVH